MPWAILPPSMRNCSRCWRPLDRCVCPVSALFPDEGQRAALVALKTRADDGAWRGPDDSDLRAQQRWAFLLWLCAHGKVALE